MKKIILGSLLLLNGCGTMITVPIDSTSLSEEKSTLIVYHEQGVNDEFRIYVDDELMGSVTSEKPLKMEVEPGKHKLYGEVPTLIRQVTNKTFEKGKVYYMKVWADWGDRFIGSLRIEPTDKVESYTVRSFK